MISGVSVDVLRPVLVGVDRFNNAEYEYETATVDNVLVAPGATEDLAASRPDGVSVAYTLHFPKSFTDDLEGCIVRLPAPYSGDYAVIGKPTPYMLANTPTPWYMPVEVAVAHG